MSPHSTIDFSIPFTSPEESPVVFFFFSFGCPIYREAQQEILSQNPYQVAKEHGTEKNGENIPQSGGYDL